MDDRLRRRREVLRAAQQRVAEAQDEMFKRAVEADVERVLAELKAGRMADLRDWSAELDAETVLAPVGGALVPDGPGRRRG